MKRTLKLRHGEYELVGAVAATRGDEAKSRPALSPSAAARLLRRASDDPWVARRLRLALGDLVGGFELVDRTDLDVIEHFARLAETRRVALRPAAKRAPSAPRISKRASQEAVQGAAPPPPSEPSMEPQSWLEIVLVDEDGEPIVAEKCELTAPDGTRLGTFMTDGEGKIRLERVQPGEYGVRFTELDAESWEAA